MNTYAALLRAVNVGGTGKLPMQELRTMCEELGFADVRTYIQSGNAVFHSELAEGEVKTSLETRLTAYSGTPASVCVRTTDELLRILQANPFTSQPGKAVSVIFLNTPLPPEALTQAKGLTDEEMTLGEREIYVFYPSGMGRSRLRIPGASSGTARNITTVTKLHEMAASLENM